MIVDAQIDKSVREGLNFGMESSYSGMPGPDMVERVIRVGYRVEGLYFGTADPRINIGRIEYRVFAGTGHAVDHARIPDRWKYSLSNLRRTVERFDLLRLFDNSEHDEFRRPRPIEQCRLKRWRVSWQVDEPATWCTSWLQRFAQRQADLKRLAAKLARDSSPLPPAKPQPAESAATEAPRRLAVTRRHRREPDRGNYEFTG